MCIRDSDKADDLLERYMQKDFRKRINKILRQSQDTTNKKTRRKRGKIGGLSHAVADEAVKAKTLSPEESQDLIDKLRGDLSDIDLDDEHEFFELDGRIRAVELLYDFMNAGSKRLSDAYDFVAGNYKAGREEVLAELKRRQEWKRKQVDELIAHMHLDESEGRRKATGKAQKAEKKKAKNVNEFIIEFLGSQHQHVARMLENSKDTDAAREIFNRIIDGRIHAETQAELERERVQDQMFDIIAEVSGKTRMKKMHARKFLYDAKKEVSDHGITTLEGFSSEKVKVPKDAVQAILDGDVAGYDGELYSKRDLIELERAWEKFNDLPQETQNQRQKITFDRIKSSGQRFELADMSQAQALNLWLTMRQPDQKGKLETMGFDSETMAELESFLTDDMKTVGLWMVSHLEGEGKAISKIHEREYFIKLPTIEQYFPVNNIVVGKEHEMDAAQQRHVGKNMSPGATKERVSNLAEPNTNVDAFSVFLGHVAEMTWWKHNVQWVREWGGVFRDKEFARVAKAAVGEMAYTNLTRYIDNIQNRGANEGKSMLRIARLVRTLNKRFALGVLGMRASTMFINATAFLNPFGSGEVSTRRVLRNMVKMAFDSKGELKATWANDLQKMRREYGSSFEASIAMTSDTNLHWAVQDMEAAAQLGLAPMNYADVASNTLTMAAIYRAKYEDSLEAGMDEELAGQEAQRSVSRAVAMLAQPTLMTSRSFAEMETMHNPFFAIFTMFRSEIRKNAANNYFAWRTVLTGKGIVDRKTAARQAAFWTLVYPAVSVGFREIYSAIARDEDDDEFWNRVTSWEYWTYMLAGDSARAVPVLGDVAMGSVGNMLGQKTYGSKTPVESAVMKFGKWDEIVSDDKTGSEQIDAWIDSAQALTIFPGGAAVSQTANLAEFLKAGILKESETPMSEQIFNLQESLIRSRLFNDAKELHKELYDKDATTPEEKRRRFEDVAAAYQTIKDSHPELWPEISAKLEKQNKLPKAVRKLMR